MACPYLRKRARRRFQPTSPSHEVESARRGVPVGGEAVVEVLARHAEDPANEQQLDRMDREVDPYVRVLARHPVERGSAHAEDHLVNAEVPDRGRTSVAGGKGHQQLGEGRGLGEAGPHELDDAEPVVDRHQRLVGYRAVGRVQDHAQRDQEDDPTHCVDGGEGPADDPRAEEEAQLDVIGGGRVKLGVERIGIVDPHLGQRAELL